MSSISKLYNFYIVATAKGGAQLFQHASIQIFADCTQDVISLNLNMPNTSE